MSRNDVINTWQRYWMNKEHLVGKHMGLSPIFIELQNIIGNFENKLLLECGSGVSEISIDISENKGKVFLVDISIEALKLSKEYFNHRNLKANHVSASIFHLPFRNNIFDVVWNAGVLEHYSFEDQIVGLKEMSRVCKQNGYIITFNPYKYAILYRLGKFFAEKKGKWEFGTEFPVKSLKHHADELGLKLIKEYSFDFKHQITFLKYFNIIIYYFIKSLYSITPKFLKIVWLKIFNGYLLVSILRKV